MGIGALPIRIPLRLAAEQDKKQNRKPKTFKIDFNGNGPDYYLGSSGGYMRLFHPRHLRKELKLSPRQFKKAYKLARRLEKAKNS